MKHKKHQSHAGSQKVPGSKKYKPSLLPSTSNKEPAASSQPFAEKKLNHTGQDTPAEKRGKGPAESNRTGNLRLSEEGKNADAPWCGSERLTVTAVYPCGGGPLQSKNLKHPKHASKHIYDPLYGNHVIPRIENPHLLEYIASEENLLRAIAAVGSDPNKAPGWDHKTVREVCESLKADPVEREALLDRIMSGKYYPSLVQTVAIPKANGKKRNLGIASVLDRIVQTMIWQAVQDHLPTSSWNPYSFAYQPGRSVKDAIVEVDRIRGEGYQYAIKVDLKAFFDNVPHGRLIPKLEKHVADVRVVRLVTRFLTAIIRKEDGSLVRNRMGSPQGSVLSPWLTSMLYLDELDQETTKRKLRFVRYADDVTVFCNSPEAAVRIKNNLIAFIEGTLKCPVNKEKTTIVPIKELSLLGIFLRDGKWHIDREKLLGVRGETMAAIKKYEQTKDDLPVWKSIQKLRGFMNHYKHISYSLWLETEALKRWCLSALRDVNVPREASYERLYEAFKKL